MPVQLTYPGVYLEEVKSGSSAVSGTSTSVTAFIGAAKRGPVNDPVTVYGFAEFERTFGGLWTKSQMSYAVYHYFLNGGGIAVINRIHNNASKASITLDEDGNELLLIAANGGAWSNKLRARVDHDVSEDIADSFGLDKAELFNLSVYDGNTGVVEDFRNITVVDSPRRVDNILEGYSKLVRVSGTMPSDIPSANDSPEAGQTVWDSDTASTMADGLGTDGDSLTNTQYDGSSAEKTGIYAFDKVDTFNLMCIPPISSSIDVLYSTAGAQSSTLTAAVAYCKTNRAMMILDPPLAWTDKAAAFNGYKSLAVSDENAAIFFPRLIMPDPLYENRNAVFAPSGAVAGIFARTDSERGIWKAPAGVAATLKGVLGLTVRLSDGDHGELNPIGVNCLRTFPSAGSVIYGSRTCKGADSLVSEFKYIPVRRLTLYIEESLYRGTQFAVFEPNDEPLWSDIRFSITSFMQDLYRKGAFQGTSADQAYFVKCDSDTTTQDDIDRGIVNIMVGFAPLKPAEFVVIKIQQMAGQSGEAA